MYISLSHFPGRALFIPFSHARDLCERQEEMRRRSI